MTEIKEPAAMAEIREIRKNLSDELSGLLKEDLIKHIKKGADELKREFGLKLKRFSKRSSITS